MPGRYRAKPKKNSSMISLILVTVLAFSGMIALPQSSNATTPAISSVSPESGSAAGGNVITITGQSLTSATAVRIDGVDVASFTIVSGTSITATVPTRADSSRTVGRKAITVELSDGSTASGQVFYTYRPTLIATAGSSLPMLTLGDLASRTQAKPLTRSAQAPFTVTGTDSITGNSYTYVTDQDKTDYASEPGWRNEGHEVGLAKWPGTSHNLTGAIRLNQTAPNSVGGGTGFLNLSSSGSCVTTNRVSYGSPSQNYDSYCSVFGPEVYSEAFYGEVGQSLAFTWAAEDNGDDYEIYAYLVSVPDSTTIPSPSTSNHTLLVHSSGDLQPFKTSSGDITASGLYRFRFVNGTYDATGGKVLGSNMYVDPVISVGLANVISIPNMGDQIGTSGSTTVVVTSTSGAEVSISASGSSNCSVTRSYSSPNTTVTISWSQVGSCIITGTQGASGAFAAASAASKGFDIRASATVPTAPTITAITESSGSATITFNPPNRDGGASISNYQYSLDNGSNWLSFSPSVSSSPVSVSGLTVGTTYQVRLRAVNAQGNSPASNMMSITISTIGGSGGPNSAGSSYSPALVHVATLPVVPRTNTSQVSMFGAYFDTVTEVLIDGKKAELVGQSKNRLILKLPGGLEGWVDVKIKSTIGTLSLPKHFNFRSGLGSSSSRAELVVGGFAHNSRVLTPIMRSQIERWIAQHPNLKTLRCTGFTSLPRRTTDVALSTNRGTTACDFSKSRRSDLTTSVTQGIEDPRPGSNIRRVRLVLTP